MTPGRRIVLTANDPDRENLEGARRTITQLPYDAAVVDALLAAADADANGYSQLAAVAADVAAGSYL